MITFDKILSRLGRAFPWIVALICSMAVACGGPATSPSVSARAIGRGAVDVLDVSYKEGAAVCRAVAQVKHDQATLEKCAATFAPIGNSLVIAAAAVDAWGDADQKNLPCALQDMIVGFERADVLLTSLGVTLPAQAAQGLELASSLAPQCTRPDAGIVDAGQEN